jgi:hypothetical protein
MMPSHKTHFRELTYHLIEITKAIICLAAMAIGSVVIAGLIVATLKAMRLA